MTSVVDVVLDSGLFSPEWYAATTGATFDSPVAAARDYVARSASGRRRFAPHPAFSRLWVAAQGAPCPPGRDPLSFWLEGAVDRTSPHPLLPVGLPQVPGDLVERSLEELGSLRSGRTIGTPVQAPRVLIGVTGPDRSALRTLAGLVADGGWTVEVRVGDAPPELVDLLAGCAVLAAGVEVVPGPWSTTEAADVLVRPGTGPVAPETLRRLLAAAGPGAAQPVVLDEAGLVLSAGADSGLLGRHPRDLADLGTVEVAGLDSPVVAGTSDEPARVVLVADATVERGSAEPLTSRPRAGVPPLRSRLRVGEEARSLRWTIDTACVHARRERWGDWHFAQSLAAALERRGQHVAVDSREARGRASRDLDDVVLVLRGLDRVEPTGGPTSLLWVISHPDDVTAAEVAGFDRVFAASVPWADDRSRAWGVPVTALLQCTDTTRFHPPTQAPAPGDGLLYVANARPEPRRMLTWAVEAGVPLDVHGSGWGDRLPAGWLRSTWVDNEELGGRYAAARAVLNDHHPDMAASGFVANRLFDAVATEAVVLSDPVPGMEELFDGCVVSVESAADLARIARDLDRWAPDRDRRRRAARHVAEHHSFDARAEKLLAAALELRAGRSS